MTEGFARQHSVSHVRIRYGAYLQPKLKDIGHDATSYQLVNVNQRPIRLAIVAQGVAPVAALEIVDHATTLDQTAQRSAVPPPTVTPSLTVQELATGNVISTAPEVKPRTRLRDSRGRFISLKGAQAQGVSTGSNQGTRSVMTGESKGRAKVSTGSRRSTAKIQAPKNPNTSKVASSTSSSTSTVSTKEDAGHSVKTKP